MLSLETNEQTQMASTSRVKQVILAVAGTATVGAVLAFGFGKSAQSTTTSVLSYIPEDFKGSLSFDSLDGTYLTRGVFHKYENEIGDWKIDARIEALGDGITASQTYNLLNNTITVTHLGADGKVSMANCFNKARWPAYGQIPNILEQAQSVEKFSLLGRVQYELNDVCADSDKVYTVRFDKTYVLCPSKVASGFQLGIVTQDYVATIAQHDDIKLHFERHPEAARLKCTQWNPKGVQYKINSIWTTPEDAAFLKSKSRELTSNDHDQQIWPFIPEGLENEQAAVVAPDSKRLSRDRQSETARRLDGENGFSVTMPIGCKPPTAATAKGPGDPRTITKQHKSRGYLDEIRGLGTTIQSFNLHNRRHDLAYSYERYAEKYARETCVDTDVQGLTQKLSAYLGEGASVNLARIEENGHATLYITGVESGFFEEFVAGFDAEKEMAGTRSAEMFRLFRHYHSPDNTGTMDMSDERGRGGDDKDDAWFSDFNGIVILQGQDQPEGKPKGGERKPKKGRGLVGGRRLKDLSGVGSFVPGKGWYVPYPINPATSKAPTREPTPGPPTVGPPTPGWGNPTPSPTLWVQAPTPDPTTRKPTWQNDAPYAECFMWHGAGGAGIQARSDLTDVELQDPYHMGRRPHWSARMPPDERLTGQYAHHYFGSPQYKYQWKWPKITGLDEGFSYWGHVDFYGNGGHEYLRGPIPAEHHPRPHEDYICRRLIMIDTDARNQGYDFDSYSSLYANVIGGATFPGDLGQIVFTHSMGGPSFSRALVAGFTPRGIRPLMMAAPPMKGSKGANFAEWACSDGDGMINQIVNNVQTMGRGTAWDTVVTRLEDGVEMAMGYSTSNGGFNVGSYVTQWLQDGAYCIPNWGPTLHHPYVIYDNFGHNSFHFSITNFAAPSHQTACFVSINNSDTSFPWVLRHKSAQWNTPHCTEVSGDPQGCDVCNFVIGTHGMTYNDKNRHDDDDPGKLEWFNWSGADDDTGSGYVYNPHYTASSEQAFWNGNLVSWAGSVRNSGDTNPHPNNGLDAWKSNGRLCGYSAWGLTLGGFKWAAMFVIAIMSQLEGHYDPWCMLWIHGLSRGTWWNGHWHVDHIEMGGPQGQLCWHRGCKWFHGCDAKIGPMEENDGMCDMTACAYGKHHAAPVHPQLPNSQQAPIKRIHPWAGVTRTMIMSAHNHGDNTCRWGDGWLGEGMSAFYSAAQSFASSSHAAKVIANQRRPCAGFFSAQAQYHVKEAYVDWCVNNGKITTQGNAWGACKFLNYQYNDYY
jgi:hypothetical protein